MSTPHVLARKYRPQRFAEVVGQDHVVKALKHGVLHNRLHHAYLLTGTRGVGKTTLARILAKAANCETLHAVSPPVDAEPCGVCEHCKAIEQGAFPDLVEIDAASNTGVDAMRTLLETVVYPPFKGRKKIYVIDEVHMLSTSAFNAMLKTLEEPPDYLTFVLATTDPQKVPITILSRCLQFNLKPMPESLLIEHFAKVLAKEGIHFDADALPLIARSADGSVRDGLSLMDQLLAQGDGELNAERVQSVLGLVGRAWTMVLLEKILARQTDDLVKMTDALESLSMAFDDVLAELARAVLALQIVQLGGPCTEDAEGEKLRTLTSASSPEATQLMYQIILQGRRDLPFAPDEKSGFLMTLLRVMAFMPANEVTTPPQGFAPMATTPSGAPLPVAQRLNAQGVAATPKAATSAPNQTKASLPPQHPDHEGDPDGQLGNAEVDGALALMPHDAPTPYRAALSKVPAPDTQPTQTSPTQRPSATEGDWGFLHGTDWAALVDALQLPPNIWRIAAYSAPYACEALPPEDDETDTRYQLTLALAETEQHLLRESMQGPFVETLIDYVWHQFGKRIVVAFCMTPLPPASVAGIQKSFHQAINQRAQQALANNPVWQTLTQEYSATLLEESLRIVCHNAPDLSR